MSVPQTIDPEQSYQVTLARSCEVLPGVWARPGDDVVVTGAVLVTIRDAVAEAVPVTVD